MPCERLQVACHARRGPTGESRDEMKAGRAPNTLVDRVMFRIQDNLAQDQTACRLTKAADREFARGDTLNRIRVLCAELLIARQTSS